MLLAPRLPTCPQVSSRRGIDLNGSGAEMRVLVVEDSRTLADLIVEGLQDEGMAVDVAYDGVAAASKLELARYQVVVLDRSLPGLSGDALCRRIGERRAPTMVLMLTGASAPEDRVAGLMLGAGDYLAKPFHFPELVLRIRALARRQPHFRARILRAGDVELDPMRYRAARDGLQVELTAKEFGVLEALLRSDGCVLSAESLLEQVWDEHADPFTNTVLVTISRLRRKLGNPPIIETIPGVGYRVAAQPEAPRPDRLDQTVP
jgi:DNA-binding response OmpR family regulator